MSAATIIVILGAFNVTRYFVQVFQIASSVGTRLGLQFPKGPGVVEVESPMRDIDVVADPVEQLAAAVVVVPAPVHMEARFDVRQHFGRTGQKLVIEFRRRLGNMRLISGSFEIIVTAGQADFHPCHFADESVADDFRRFVEIRFGPLPGTGLPDAPVVLDRLHDRLLLGDGFGQRFPAKDVLLAIGRFDRRQRMPMVRDGQYVDIGAAIISR